MSEARVLGSPAGRAYAPTVTRVKTVRVIPPTIQPLSDIPAFSARPRRVAAYARVSTSSEEQLTSYEAQVKLSEKIQVIAEQKRDKAVRRRRIEIFLRMLEEQKECVGFEPGTFVALIDKVIIQRDGGKEFYFRNGMKYAYQIREKA